MASTGVQGGEVQGEVETMIDTAVGCPYGLAAEAVIQADGYLIDIQNTVKLKEVGEDAFFAGIDTAIEADYQADDLSAGILSCETCAGNPHTVDLGNKVCQFALRACSGDVFTPSVVREFMDRDEVLGS